MKKIYESVQMNTGQKVMWLLTLNILNGDGAALFTKSIESLIRENGKVIITGQNETGLQ